MFKLVDWVPEDKLTADLSSNPRAIEYLDKHPEKINWMYLSDNPDAVFVPIRLRFLRNR